MLYFVALVRTDDSEERSALIIKLARIGEVGTLVITSNGHTSMLRFLIIRNVDSNSSILLTLMIKALRSSETSVGTRDIWRNISKDRIFHNHLRSNLKSCTISSLFAYNNKALYDFHSVSHIPILLVTLSSYAAPHKGKQFSNFPSKVLIMFVR
jgi:hypothetical protein